MVSSERFGGKNRTTQTEKRNSKPTKELNAKEKFYTKYQLRERK